MSNSTSRAVTPPLDTEFVRQLGLFDSTTIVVGSMIGSGIFIVSILTHKEYDLGRWKKP